MVDRPVWQTGGPPTVRPPLAGPLQADVCVVGLGGSGLAAAAEALRLGRSVVGVDAGEVGCGAAGRNGGFLLAGAPDFHHTAVERLGRERAAAVYRLTLAEIGRTPTARLVGSLRVADDPVEQQDCGAMLDQFRADGFEAEWYEGPEGVGVLMPGDGAFDPLARCCRAADAAEAEGARLFERSPARSVEARRVTTPGGVVECGAVVVAVDGGLERVLPELAGRVRTARLQMLSTGPVERVVAPRPVYARWGYDYWQQLPDGRVALGGCRDRFAEQEWSFDAVPTESVQACLDRLLWERVGVGANEAAVDRRWAGCAGFTPTRMPVCELVRPGLAAAGGYCGTGNVLGVLCGRAAVRLALGEPVADLAPVVSARQTA